MEKKIAKWKIEKVNELKKLLEENDIIGVVNLEGLPCLQLQKIKKKLKGKINLFMTRKKLMKRALVEVKKDNFDKISENLKGVPALLFSKEEPFSLFNTLKKSKTKTVAKPGQIAPNDLIVKKGPTSFPPGPIIGELGSAGIMASVEDGKVVVQKDVVLVKEGDEISKEKADILSKLGIEPMEVGLNLVSVYNKGEILGKDVLDIDEEEYVSNIISGYWNAINLGVDVGYVVDENVEILVSKGVREGKVLEESLPKVEDELKKGVVESEKLKENLLEKASGKTSTGKVVEEVEEKKEEVKEEPLVIEEKILVEEKPIEGEREDVIEEKSGIEKKELSREEIEKVPTAEELLKESERDINLEKSLVKKK